MTFSRFKYNDKKKWNLFKVNNNNTGSYDLINIALVFLVVLTLKQIKLSVLLFLQLILNGYWFLCC